jgi:putative sigma-54 modulation protein
MDLHVKGKNIPVTDALFNHAQRKLAKLTRILPPWDEPPHVELELSVERNPSIDRNQVCEVTVRTKGPVLRVRESDRDMYLAIDHAVQKLERQAGRYRDRRRRHRPPHGTGAPSQIEIPAAADAPPVVIANAADDEPEPRLVKTKRFEMKPMSVEDAAMQIELLNHDFYVFRNDDDGAAVSVIYRRRDGDLGLIAPG